MGSVSALDALPLLAALLAAGISSIVVSSAIDRGRRGERQYRLMVEEIRLRETQLRYESANDAHARRVVVDLMWASLRQLDELEAQLPASASENVRESLAGLRQLQHEQIRRLLGAYESDPDDRDLGQLESWSTSRRADLGSLSDDRKGGRPVD